MGYVWLSSTELTSRMARQVSYHVIVAARGFCCRWHSEPYLSSLRYRGGTRRKGSLVILVLTDNLAHERSIVLRNASRRVRA